MDLKKLNNENLIQSTQNAINNERKMTLTVLNHLYEIESRRLYFKYGYNSLFAMLVTHFCYSEASAQRRINSMRLIKDLPEVSANIQKGELTLSSAASVQNFFKTNRMLLIEEKRKVIAACLNKSAREVDKELAARNPDRDKREIIRYSKSDRLRMSINISEDLYVKLERLKYELQFATIEELLHDLLEKALIEKDVTSKLSPISKPTTRSISRITKKIVMKRNEDKRCEYVDPETYERCTETHDLQFDHRIPYSKGGPNIVENLRQLCGLHNRYVWNKEQK